MTDLPRLSAEQQRLVRMWLPAAEFVADLSWELMGTVVFRLRAPDGEYIVKAGGPTNHHIDREIRAHRQFTGPWTARERCARMVHYDLDAKILALNWLSGDLVERSPAEFDPNIYHQAGSLLAMLHAQSERADPDYELRETRKSLQRLDSTHRIDPETVERLRTILRDYEPRPVTLVPTHGDWHPRNWLVEDGIVRAIDLGRADWRPAYTDFARLAVRQFRADPALEAAFLDGYGTDPRFPESWRMLLVREAIGTAVWAFEVGDEPFEQEGHRMIRSVLDASGADSTPRDA